MGKRLNPLEKEMLIRLYRRNPDIRLAQFCEANGVTPITFKKWMQQYDENGLEGLITPKDDTSILPGHLDRTEENYKREILKLTIENERLKKNYIVRKTEDGKTQIQRLEVKNTKSSDPSPDDIP